MLDPRIATVFSANHDWVQNFYTKEKKNGVCYQVRHLLEKVGGWLGRWVGNVCVYLQAMI